MEMVLPPDFSEFLKFLNRNEVEYLLIGGYAVNYYGYVRYTGDIDIWVRQSLENAEKLTRAFADFGFKVEVNDFLQPKAMVRFGVSPLKVEVITQISGVDFSECYVRRLSVEIDGLQIPLIDLASLRRNKAAIGRPKDLADLAGLPNVEE